MTGTFYKQVVPDFRSIDTPLVCLLQIHFPLCFVLHKANKFGQSSLTLKLQLDWPKRSYHRKLEDKMTVRWSYLCLATVGQWFQSSVLSAEFWGTSHQGEVSHTRAYRIIITSCPLPCWSRSNKSFSDWPTLWPVPGCITHALPAPLIQPYLWKSLIHYLMVSFAARNLIRFYTNSFRKEWAQSLNSS